MQTKVLLSIKPEFAAKIFNGTKRYEFRRKLFRNADIKSIIVYASSPICKVIGEFKIDCVLELETEILWRKTKDYSGITKQYFDKYFCGNDKGYAIKIASVQLYEKPIEFNKIFKIKRPPQSFMYICK